MWGSERQSLAVIHRGGARPSFRMSLRHVWILSLLHLLFSASSLKSFLNFFLCFFDNLERRGLRIDLRCQWQGESEKHEYGEHDEEYGEKQSSEKDEYGEHEYGEHDDEHGSE